MERNNTDDLFKKILESPPPMRPDLEALEDMNQRLDKAQRKRKGALWWWLLPLSLLPLLFTSIFYYFKYQTAKNTINEIKLQLTDSQIDTLTQRLTIYEYDTVVNTIYKEVIVQRTREELPTLIAGNGSFFSPPNFPNYGRVNPQTVSAIAFNTFDKSSLQPSQLELLRNGKVISLGQIGEVLAYNESGFDLEKSNTETTRNKWAIIDRIEELSFLDTRFAYEHPLPLSDHFFALSKKSEADRINPLWYLVPTGFQAGINWSPIGIANLPGSSNRVKTIGFLGEVEFTKNTRLQFGIEYLSAPLKAETPTEVSLFPMFSPDDPGDFFKEIYGDFTYLQVPLTLKYVFQANKKWMPSIGVGMIARLPLKEQLRYEFVSVRGGEYTRALPFNDGSFDVNNLRGTVGVEYNFYKNYTIQAEGYYNYQFGSATNPYFQLRYGGLNMGLKYKF